MTEMTETGWPDTVFARLVQRILSDSRFRSAVLGMDEEERKRWLYAFVADEYPELKENPEELKAKQREVWEAFNQVLLTLDLDRIGKLRNSVNKLPPIFIPI